MTTGTDLSDGIALFEAEMVDACTVVRGRPGTDDDTIDPVTLELTSPAGAELYNGKCLLLGGGRLPAVEDVGGEQETVKALSLAIPPSVSADLQRGDQVVMTGSRWHPEMVGRVLLVRAETTASLSVCRRFDVQERL